MNSVPERPRRRDVSPLRVNVQYAPDNEDARRRCMLAALFLLQYQPPSRREPAAPAVEPPGTTPSPKPKRTPRLKPSSIAAFEAQWQAEHAGDEAES